MKTLELLVIGVICTVISQGYFSLAEQCLDRFMDLSLIQLRASRIGQGTPTGIERMNNEIRIMTNIQFTCDSQIDSVLLGIDIRYNRDEYPSVQLWRPTGVSETIQLVSEQMIVYTPANVSSTGVYQYPLTTPLNAIAGDYLAISQPRRSVSRVRAFTIDVQSNSSYSITHGSGTADLDQEVAEQKLVLLYPNSAQLSCITSTVTESFVKDQSLLITRTIEVSSGRQLFYPDMKFKCNGTINKWIYAGIIGSSIPLLMPELQVWRLTTGTTDTYNKIGASQVIVNETVNSNVHELSVDPPIEFMEGDIFGLHQSIEISRFTSHFILHLQENSGPCNFCVSNNVNNALSTLNFSTLVEVDNDYPLVTMEISQHITIVSSSSVLVSASRSADSHNLVVSTGPSTDQFTGIYITKSTNVIATHRPLTSSCMHLPASSSLISTTTYTHTYTSITNATSSTLLESAIIYSPPSAIGVNDTVDASSTTSSQPSITQLSMLIVMILGILVLVLIVGVSTACVLATVIVWRKKTRRKDGNITSDNVIGMNDLAYSPNEVSCDMNVSYNQVHHHYMTGSKGRSQLIDDDDDAYTTIEGAKLAVEQNLVYDTII